MQDMPGFRPVSEHPSPQVSRGQIKGGDKTKKVIAVLGFLIMAGAILYAYTRAPDSSTPLGIAIMGFAIMLVGLVKS